MERKKRGKTRREREMRRAWERERYIGELLGERRRETEREREGGVRQMCQNYIPTMNMNTLWYLDAIAHYSKTSYHKGCQIDITWLKYQYQYHPCHRVASCTRSPGWDIHSLDLGTLPQGPPQLSCTLLNNRKIEVFPLIIIINHFLQC